MKRLFAIVCAFSLLAGTAFANGEGPPPNGPPGLNRNNVRIQNSNRNQNTNRNTNHNSNRNSNSNRNYNTNTNVNTNLNTNQQQQSQQQGQYQGQGQHQGQVGIVKDGDVSVQGDTYSTKVYAPAPDAIAPALTSGNDVCMGSVSVSASGGSGIIGIGIGFGKTYTDENCVRLKNANALLQLGHKDAALALLAINDDVAAALKATGTTFAGIRLEMEPIRVASEATDRTPPSDMESGYWGIDFEQID